MLIAILSIMVGRFFEQIVGLARVLDMTIFWALLAVFVSLPQVMGDSPVTSQAVPEPPVPQGRRRCRSRNPTQSSVNTGVNNWKVIGRLAIVAWLIGGIFVVTWVKSINSVRAAESAGDAVEHVQRGDLQATLGALAGC